MVEHRSKIDAEICAHGIGACRFFAECQCSAPWLLIVKLCAVRNEHQIGLQPALPRHLQHDCAVIPDFEDQRIFFVFTGDNSVSYGEFPRHQIGRQWTVRKSKLLSAARHPERDARRRDQEVLALRHHIAAAGKAGIIIRLLPARGKERADDEAEHKRQRDEHLRGLFVQHPLHALLDPDLSKGQRTDRDRAARNAVRQQHTRVALLFR